MNGIFLLTFNYRSIRAAFTYLIFLAITSISAQNINIRGKAHNSYAGEVIRLTVASDYITNQPITESLDTIGEDGFFELQYQSEYTRPVDLRIGNVVARLYVEPDFVYGVTIPAIDDSRFASKEVDQPVNIGIVGADSTELNRLIFDFQELHNSLLVREDKGFISRARMFRLADSLQRICDKRYATVSHPYFKNFVLYSIASINASVSRGENYLLNNYIIGKPLRYWHSEYMQFFNTCFKGYLNVIASRHSGQSLYNIINIKASYQLLSSYVKADQLMENDTLRELVIIKNLWDFYFSPEFNTDAIENIISEIQLKTVIARHRNITSNMLAYMNKLQTGSPAPGFSARARNGGMFSIDSLKGKWIYLNFFSTANTESLKEMPKIASLKKKYGDKVKFVSVCLDDSIADYKKYLRNNPRFDWTILYNYDRSVAVTARDKYYVVGTEAYFLINNLGYLSQAPALAPSKGIEYRFNIIFKIKTRTTKTGIR